MFYPVIKQAAMKRAGRLKAGVAAGMAGAVKDGGQ
jgi:hypothetical protein